MQTHCLSRSPTPLACIAELRFQRAQVCRNQGVHHALDLLQLSPRQTWEHNIRISFASEAYVQDVVRNEVQRDIQHHRGKPTSDLDDWLRSRIPAFVKSALQRAGHDRAQWIKDEPEAGQNYLITCCGPAHFWPSDLA
jgi:hypothetical protein